MSSRALRTETWGLLKADSGLIALGYLEEGVYSGYGGDSPPQRLFMILRWGSTGRGVGPANSVALDIWVYNREPDYGPVVDAIARIKELLPTLIAKRFADGSGGVLGADWQGDGDDSYDDAYKAFMRRTSWLMTAGGN